jgi:putative phosphoribosyl transferase
MERSHQLKSRRGLLLSAISLIPAAAERPAVVVFAHGWGSSKRSPRNREIAEALVEAGIAAFLFDFSGHGDSESDPDPGGLREQEDDLRDVLDFVAAQPGFAAIGLAGSSSGGAVAVAVAAADPRVQALVLRSPSADTRPGDAAGVRAPTLVLQGRLDPLCARNERLADCFGGEHRFHAVARANHLFEEPAAFQEALRETVHWFERWLLGGASVRRARGARRAVPDAHFGDRAGAGRALAEELGAYAGADTLVLALPRGGIAVAEPIARRLGAELDVFISRKIRAPGQPELAIGAIAEGDVVVWNEAILTQLGVMEGERAEALARSRHELVEREREYRAVRPRAPLAKRTVIVVDDGVATGATLRAAIVALGKLGVKRLVVALPGGASDTLDEVAQMKEVHALVALARPEPFYSVGQLYDEFPAISSAQVCRSLARFVRR